MKLVELLDETFKLIALSKISDVITTSSHTIQFSNRELDWLRQTVKKPSMKLYRGIGLVQQRMDKSQMMQVNKLQPGDIPPKFLLENIHSSDIINCTKSISVAKYYSEGQVSIILELNVPSIAVAADLSYLPELVAREQLVQDFLDEDDFEYMIKDKEVLIMPNNGIEVRINRITGRFRI